MLTSIKKDISLQWRNKLMFMLVLEDQKPAWIYEQYSPQIVREVKELGCEIKKFSFFKGEPGQADYSIIAKPNIAGPHFKNMPVWVVKRYPNIQSEIDAIKDLSIVNAVYHILDARAEGIEDLLIGVLLGFKWCDIKYFLDSRKISSPEHRVERGLHESWNSVDHVMCPACVAAIWKYAYQSHLD